MEEENYKVHVLVVAFPAQGHVNPGLRLAKLLAFRGLYVTFSTTLKLADMIQNSSSSKLDSVPLGKGHLNFDFFSDGWPWEDSTIPFDGELWMDTFTHTGPKALASLIERQDRAGRAISCIIGNPFIAWVLDVATNMGISCGLLWVQPCAIFSAYYHHCKGLVKFPSSVDESHIKVQLPGLPLLSPEEVPSFMLENNPYKNIGRAMFRQFDNLDKASWVIVDSFDELERPIINSLAALSRPITAVGPLFKSIPEDGGSTSVKADIWQASECLEWLNSQAPSTVVYVSLGSVAVVEGEQLEEMAWGIQNSGNPFLWVVKPRENEPEANLPEGFLEETAGRGLVVKWCPQEQVLSHPSLSCFLTHCGWNSSLESVYCGVPIIALPQWGDQVTNAKFFEEVCGTGIRLRKGENSIVSRGEIERCIKEVMGDSNRAKEMRKNALKLKKAAEAAIAEGGSSDLNIKAIVDDIRQKGGILSSVKSYT